MKRFPKIILVSKIYLLAIAIFFIFRFILFLTELNRIASISESLSNIFLSFVMGIRFDLVITGYIMFLPTFLLLVFDVFRIKTALLNKILFWWIFSLFTISFLICAADIPYFNQFFSRFSITALEWIENTSFVINMIIEEPKYFLVAIPFLIVVVLFYKLLKRVFHTSSPQQEAKTYLKAIIYIFFIGLIFLGIRGRVQRKSPIRIGTAYFCNDPFLNQLGLNPVFTFMRSYLDSKSEKNKTIKLVDDNEAIAYVQKSFNIKQPINNNPISRKITVDSVNQNPPNVVLIIMESMSAAKMSRHGNPNQLTPFLDSLSNNSIYFENIYTAGIHTFNGVFSTLFSYPALYRQHPMKQIKTLNGIASTLKQHNYSTTYFTTHDGQFDNVEGFLRANYFENIITQSNYPLDKIETTLGVTDDYMFEFSMPIIDSLHNQNKPFFVSFMTASDHGPYFIPEYFKPKSDEVKNQIVEYADWSLSKFIKMAKQKDWFKNTLFVFIADHGAAMNTNYDISLAYHHSPLIFYAPEILGANQVKSNIGGQIDVFPTIMGLLNLPYTNETLGIDLINEERPYIYVNGDDKIGVLDEEFLLIFQNNTDTKLFKYKNRDKTDYIKQHSDKAKEMELYAKSNMQVFQHILLKN